MVAYLVELVIRHMREGPSPKDNSFFYRQSNSLIIDASHQLTQTQKRKTRHERNKRTFKNNPYCCLPSCFMCPLSFNESCKLLIQKGKLSFDNPAIMSAVIASPFP